MCPTFRFAPSPNGALHLGHALSALINFKAARRMAGRCLLRIEDIDVIRCSPEKIAQMLEDLRWIGFEWEEPALGQSDRFPLYQENLKELKEKGLIYPSIASRKDIQQAIKHHENETGRPHPRDPDGAPLFPRSLLKDKELESEKTAWRLDMDKALSRISKPLSWQETGPLGPDYPARSPVMANPAAWGDVILARKECPTSYHLSVVVDDALQGISHVVRGQDLYHATSLHRLLQDLLDLPAPLYHHHRLLSDGTGQKLSKSHGCTSLKDLRESGTKPDAILRMIQLSDKDLLAFQQA